jgi:hypothetical protein
VVESAWLNILKWISQESFFFSHVTSISKLSITSTWPSLWSRGSLNSMKKQFWDQLLLRDNCSFRENAPQRFYGVSTRMFCIELPGVWYRVTLLFVALGGFKSPDSYVTLNWRAGDAMALTCSCTPSWRKRIILGCVLMLYMHLWRFWDESVLA